MMIAEQRDSAWWYKLNGLLRQSLVRGYLPPDPAPLVLTEYPKSGGTWTSQMLSHVFEIPYPRNRLPKIQRCLIHGCFLEVAPKNQTVVLWRDGRDIIVSYYYHLVVGREHSSTAYRAKLHEHLGVKDPNDIEKHLPDFIQWCFEGGYPRFTWTEFADVWLERTDLPHTSYEKLKEDPHRELNSILQMLDAPAHVFDRIDDAVEEYSFANQAKRNPGEEDNSNFLRKGIVGDWKNVFTREAADVFHGYAGKVLIELGYEDDDDWVLL